MLPYLLILIGIFTFYVGLDMRQRIGPLGLGLTVLLVAVSVGSLLFASILLNYSPQGIIALIYGTFIVTGFIALLKNMYFEGLSSVLPKKKSDVIFYTVFLLSVIVLLIMSLKAAYNYYVTGIPIRLK